MIAYYAYNDGQADIYVINLDGSELTNLTNDSAEDWAPRWSPDGSLIAFQTNRTAIGRSTGWQRMAQAC